MSRLVLPSSSTDGELQRALLAQRLRAAEQQLEAARRKSLSHGSRKRERPQEMAAPRSLVRLRGEQYNKSAHVLHRVASAAQTSASVPTASVAPGPPSGAPPRALAAPAERRVVCDDDDDAAKGSAPLQLSTFAMPAEMAMPTSVRRVVVRSSAFEATASGMGLQRRAVRPGSAPGGWQVTTMDFKRQRAADERRAAKGRKLCSFFCRHGRCDGRDGAECPYAHEPECVTICQPFLHGGCSAGKEHCALSHEPAPERMPACRLFMRGLCVDPECAFSHVHLGATVEVCESFARSGYCVDGARCARRHEMLCEAYAAHGQCALGERCRLGRRPRPAAVSSGAIARIGRES